MRRSRPSQWQTWSVAPPRGFEGDDAVTSSRRIASATRVPGRRPRQDPLGDVTRAGRTRGGTPARRIAPPGRPVVIVQARRFRAAMPTPTKPSPSITSEAGSGTAVPKATLSISKLGRLLVATTDKMVVDAVKFA